MNRFTFRVCMLAAGIALAAGPMAWADDGREERRGLRGDAQYGPGSGKGTHQGRYQEHHGMRGKQGGRAHRLAPKHQRRAKMMRRTLRFIIPRLSPGQREQVRKIRLDMRRQLNTNRALLKNLRLDMREFFRQFPVNPEAVKTIFDQMAKLRWKLLSFHLSTLAEIQKLAGKKLWDEARNQTRGHAMRKPGLRHGPGPRPGGERR